MVFPHRSIEFLLVFHTSFNRYLFEHQGSTGPVLSPQQGGRKRGNTQGARPLPSQEHDKVGRAESPCWADAGTRQQQPALLEPGAEREPRSPPPRTWGGLTVAEYSSSWARCRLASNSFQGYLLSPFLRCRKRAWERLWTCPPHSSLGGKAGARSHASALCFSSR